MGVIGRQGDRQHLADRLDPMRLAVIVDEGNHGLNRRSSSAWAKYALALRRISLACRSSRFSRSRAFSFVATSVGTPARTPLSRSAFFIQNHSHRAGADLRRELVGRLACHGSTFSGVGASDQPGAVHIEEDKGL